MDFFTEEESTSEGTIRETNSNKRRNLVLTLNFEDVELQTMEDLSSYLEKQDSAISLT